METLKLYTCKEGLEIIRKGRAEGKTFRQIIKTLTKLGFCGNGGRPINIGATSAFLRWADKYPEKIVTTPYIYEKRGPRLKKTKGTTLEQIVKAPIHNNDLSFIKNILVCNLDDNTKTKVLRNYFA